MRRELLIAVAAGALGAMLLVAAWRSSVFGVLLGLMFSPIPLAMTALGLGLPYLSLAALSGMITVVVLTDSIALAALYALVDVAPTAILARMGPAIAKVPEPDKGRLLGVAVATLVIAAVLLMVTVLANVPPGTEGIEATLRGRLQQLVAEVGAARGGMDAPETMVAAMARILPGAAAWNWAFRALVSVVLAQALLARDGFARWPTPAYRTIAVPGWYLGVFWVAGVAGWLASGDAGFVATNVAICLSLPLLLQGLAVVHVAMAAFGLGRGALVAFYGFALVAAGAAFALIVVVGVMEHFLQMRNRTMRPRDGGQ